MIYQKYILIYFILSFFIILVDADEANGNQTILQSDSVPVASDGGDISLYSDDDAKKIPEDVVDKGNSAKGDGKGQ